MSINQAGAGYLGAASHALTYRAELLTMKPSAFRVEYGHGVTLSGQLVNGQPGTRVAIFARRYGSSVPTKIATLATGSSGALQPHGAADRPDRLQGGGRRAAVTGERDHRRPADADLHQLGGGRLIATASAGRRRSSESPSSCSA